MRYLIEAANEYGLQRIAEQATKYPQIHGIIVDMEPLWLALYKIYLSDPNIDLEREYYYIIDSFYYPRYHLGITLLPSPYFSTAVPFDIKWEPNFWKNISNDNKLIVKLLLRPGTEAAQIEYQGPMRLVQEHQSVPRLAAHGIPQFRPLEGGLSLGHAADDPGTLGGILEDSTGKQYALTCGHVIRGNQADQPAQSDHHTAASIGQVVFRHDPVSLGAGTLCNAYARGLNEMDLALIELNAGITGKRSIRHVGKVDGFMSNVDLHPNLQVEFHGRTSGHKTSIVLGGTGLVNEVEDSAGLTHCFQYLVEIKEPSLGSLLLNRPVKGGDSGSWVIGQGKTGNEWCGMIIGENRQTGYAITAESILNFLKANHYSVKCK